MLLAQPWRTSSLILGELCHWGNYNNIPRIPELIEMGAEFEKYTYGKIIY